MTEVVTGRAAFKRAGPEPSIECPNRLLYVVSEGVAVPASLKMEGRKWRLF